MAAAGPAAAHAGLEATDPPAGARLDEAPEEATITFSEPVQAPDGAVRVHDATGRRLPVGDLQREDGGRTLRVALPELEDGGYVLAWRVVSADGHPVGSGVTFRVGQGGADVGDALFEEILSGEEGDDTVEAASAVARTLLFAGLAGLIGGWSFLAVAWPEGAGSRRARRYLLVAWALASLGTVAGIGLQSADLAGLGLDDAVRPSVVADLLDTDAGRYALARLALLGLAGVLLLARPRARWVSMAGAAALSVGFALTVALSGHARTGRWTGLALPLDVVHLLAGAVWVGGLGMLLVAALPATTTAPADARRVAGRFSSLALAAVSVVVATGLVQALRQTDGLDGIRETTYGRLLTAKVIAVAVLLVLAFLSRSALRARDDGSLARLRQSVAGEAAMAVVVVVVTALLVAADPARSAELRSFVASRVVDGAAWEVIVVPARTGPVDVHVLVNDPDAGLTGAQEVEATLSLPARDIEGIDVPLRPVGRNHFSAYDLEVPIAGTWLLDVRVRTSEFDEQQSRFEVVIE
jgi:copper transport protein